jgi:hypothetical protein
MSSKVLEKDISKPRKTRETSGIICIRKTRETSVIICIRKTRETREKREKRET